MKQDSEIKKKQQIGLLNSCKTLLFKVLGESWQLTIWPGFIKRCVYTTNKGLCFFLKNVQKWSRGRKYLGLWFFQIFDLSTSLGPKRQFGNTLSRSHRSEPALRTLLGCPSLPFQGLSPGQVLSNLSSAYCLIISQPWDVEAGASRRWLLTHWTKEGGSEGAETKGPPVKTFEDLRSQNSSLPCTLKSYNSFYN